MPRHRTVRCLPIGVLQATDNAGTPLTVVDRDRTRAAIVQLTGTA
ncbi:MAG: hypothetical protein RBJ76_19430 [Stenomitos frigidus ULC029]